MSKAVVGELVLADFIGLHRVWRGFDGDGFGRCYRPYIGFGVALMGMVLAGCIGPSGSAKHRRHDVSGELFMWRRAGAVERAD